MNLNNRPLHKKGRLFGPLLLYIATCLVIGFICGEIMGVALVAKSNKTLLLEQEWLESMDYVAVPGTSLRKEMKSWKTYFAGGLFFALSIGLCYAFIWGLFIWGLDPWPKIRAYTSAGILGLILALFISTPGYIQLWAFGLFLFIVPLLLFPLLPIFRSCKDRKAVFVNAIPFMAGLLVSVLAVYILITPSLSSNDFARIRDGLLERTGLGRNVSNFYYHYTLYPARVIKSFDQRLQGFLRIDSAGFTETEVKRLKRALAWRDLFIGADAPASAILKKDPGTNKLLFLSDSPLFRIEEKLEKFISDPGPVLKKYYSKADPAVFLRESVKWSLFYIWPALGIFLVYGLLNILCNLLSSIFGVHISPVRETLLTCLLLLVLILGLRLLMSPRNLTVNTEGLLAIIEGKRPGDKIVAALEVWDRINDGRAKPGNFMHHFINMLEDSDPNIRKWGICFLALTGERKAAKPLIPLLNDPHTEVAYHAARALGTIRAKESKDSLLRVIKGEDEWYLKTTAYIALRKIGWNQS